ncbi:MAG: glycosyltransferase, partial [Actinomycetes bacterium]
AFDLRETRVSAAEAALYATPNDVGDLAAKVLDLLDDEELRRSMGEQGRQRVLDQLAWSRQEPGYIGVYDAMTRRRPAAGMAQEPSTGV